MYKVLIAEDEMLVRLGLKNSVSWSDFDMTVVADVSNGEEALEVYEKEKPDILITDLRMPGVSGMELIKKIRQDDNETIIIILSCVDEFEQIKKAMSLSVFEYIFKLTMTTEEINQILKKAKIKLDMQTEENRNTSIFLEELEFIKKLLLKEYILFDKLTEKEFYKKINSLNLRISNKGMFLCVLEIEGLPAIDGDYEKKNQKNDIINEIICNLKDLGNGEVFLDRADRYIILFSDISMQMKTKHGKSICVYLHKICCRLDEMYGVETSIGVSDRNDGFSYLKSMLLQAEKAIERKFIMGSGLYLFCEKPDLDAMFKENMELLKNLKSIEKMLKYECLESYYNRVDTIKNSFPIGKKEIVRQIKNLLYWSALNFSFEVEPSATAPYLNLMDKSITISNLVNIYMDCCNGIYNKKANSINNGETISCVIEYISNNYSSNLNLHLVAEEVSVSPAYLSNLFKKKLNVNLIDYLNKIRVEKAKNLLQKTNLRSYEIAEKVGIPDTSYFSKVFKKYTGLSPNKFRKMNKGI